MELVLSVIYKISQFCNLTGRSHTGLWTKRGAPPCSPPVAADFVLLGRHQRGAVFTDRMGVLLQRGIVLQLLKISNNWRLHCESTRSQGPLSMKSAITGMWFFATGVGNMFVSIVSAINPFQVLVSPTFANILSNRPRKKDEGNICFLCHVCISGKSSYSTPSCKLSSLSSSFSLHGSTPSGKIGLQRQKGSVSPRRPKISEGRASSNLWQRNSNENICPLLPLIRLPARESSCRSYFE